jgi:tetratricopeptide (TPR) repeat protein
MLVQQGDWRQVAAISEVRAQMMAAVDSESLVVPPLLSLRLRLQSDLGRALVMLKSDRAGSLAMLGNCYQMFPCDGSLADDFFPALRKAGLIKEHDEWFKESWERMTAVIRQFPGSDNTYNTVAWIASRARQNLDPAEKLLQKALAANPEQPAYLDTMAEIQFAKGNREKALEWSQRAVNFMPLDVMLRLQHERFRSGPLPR